MSSRMRRWYKIAAIAALTTPLLQAAPGQFTCLERAENALAGGFIDAVTPFLIDAFAQQLGLSPPNSNFNDNFSSNDNRFFNDNFFANDNRFSNDNRSGNFGFANDNNAENDNLVGDSNFNLNG